MPMPSEKPMSTKPVATLQPSRRMNSRRGSNCWCRGSNIALELRDQRSRIVGLHQRFADEQRVGAAGARPGGVRPGGKAALAHGDDVLREEGNEALGEPNVGLEDREVAVVHADDAGLVLQGPAQFVFGVDFKKSVEPGC